MNISFARAPWPIGGAFPVLSESVFNKIRGLWSYLPSLIIFDSCEIPSTSEFFGVRFLIPSTHIQIQTALEVKPRYGVPFTLPATLEAYRVENWDDILDGIYSFFDNNVQKASIGSKKISIERESIMYDVGAVYENLVLESGEDSS